MVIRFNEKVSEIELKTVLKRELSNRKESMNSIARACGIAPSVLHNWVQGVKPSAKNIHHLRSLSDYLGISISTLLFNEDEVGRSSTIIFSSIFKDGPATYKVIVEKMED